jgi:hypothetical protein
MRSDQSLRREADAHDDDMAVQRIEIDFAIPAFIPIEAQRELHDWICAVVKLKRNQLVGFAHWVSRYGSKPQWSQADCRFLGKPVDPDAPASGEPTFDDSVLHFETACRELTEHEQAKRAKGEV